MTGVVGGRLKRKGAYAYLWLIHTGVQQKTRQLCKAIILQLKKKKLQLFIHREIDYIKEHMSIFQNSLSTSWNTRNTVLSKKARENQKWSTSA